MPFVDSLLHHQELAVLNSPGEVVQGVATIIKPENQDAGAVEVSGIHLALRLIIIIQLEIQDLPIPCFESVLALLATVALYVNAT